MNGLLSGFTIEGGSTVGRSFFNATTDGMIQDDAGHWSIEPYIPLKTDKLADYLVQRGDLSESLHATFRQRCDIIDRLHHERTGAYHRQFTSLYASVDPDSDCKPLLPDSGGGLRDAFQNITRMTEDDQTLSTQLAASGSFKHTSAAGETGRDDFDLAELGTEKDASVEQGQTETRESMQRVIDLFGQIMDDAGYKKVERADIEKCVGVASQWGVPLHVDLDLFEQLVVYARGDIMGTRFQRRLRKMYRMEAFEIPVYQRMVVAFRLKSELQGDEALSTDKMHLRMFKNIPKEDVDTLLPGARVRISGLDHVKIIVPSLGGFLMSLRKIAQYAILFAVIALHWSLILVGLLIGYLIKSTLGYFEAKKKRELKLTRNLYFQKLDTNAGVGHRIIQQAHRQRTCELVVACYAMQTADEPLSARRLRRRCERILREAVGVEIDFQIERVLRSLQEFNGAVSDGKRWRLTPLESLS
ncbi:MAG TPA: hypothetical protein DEF45_06415 [Rhodopirellula sp.]|nr:hypothetical protein [Rhodopirellula sp.]